MPTTKWSATAASWISWRPPAAPTSTTVQMAGLIVPELLVEITPVALIPTRGSSARRDKTTAASQYAPDLRYLGGQSI